MVEECVHLYDDGRKCRRIPRRGDKLCPSHRPRRAPQPENADFRRQMSAFVDRLEAMPLEDLLYTTTAILAHIHPVIDRKSSRRHRIAFSRATAAVGIAADHIAQTILNFRRQAQQPAPNGPPQPATGATVPRSLSPASRARLEAIVKTFESGSLSPEQLEAAIDEGIYWGTEGGIEYRSPGSAFTGANSGHFIIDRNPNVSVPAAGTMHFGEHNPYSLFGWGPHIPEASK